MPGLPLRDLAVLDPWEASYARSRARRERAGRRTRRSAGARAAAPSLAELISTVSREGFQRDLSDIDPWELSLGRSRARRRAEQLRFVPASTLAKRISLGTLVALTAGPSASLAEPSRPAQGAAGPPTTIEHGIVLHEGDEGRQVELLQKALGHVEVDGIFGPETDAAVRAFQARRGLSTDGVVGTLTSASLRGEASGAAAAVSGAVDDAGGAVSQASEQATERTEINNVGRLQSALHVKPDGVFGPETEAAVMRLQARHGLAVDGVVGPATWGVIDVHGEETLTPPPSAIPQPPAPAGEEVGAVPPGEDEAGGATAPEAPPEGDTGTVAAPEAETGAATAAPTAEAEAPAAAPDEETGAETPSVPAEEPTGETSAPAATPESAPAPAPEPSSESAPAGSTSGESQSVVGRVVSAADEIATRPYVYGGGHGSFQSDGYDCSGSVSYALHGGGLISSPEDSSELESYGDAGPGKYITIYANAEHAYMTVDGRRFDTVALAETGSRWSGSSGDDGGSFVERHPAGY
jgi:peptidoglycan hydrolase-like protein with peptidoglycan-binding domain/cell wall-associated NlpC family hydrolase